MCSGSDSQLAAQLVRLGRFIGLLDDFYQSSVMQYEFSVRLALLFASILRVRQASRSVQLLAEESCIEEINAITKTLIEIVVNAAYLQYADDLEIDRYLHSDSHLVSEETERLRLSLAAQPSPRSLRIFKQNTAHAIRKLIRSADDHSWSTKTLLQRAQVSDLRSDTPVMSLLVTTMHSRLQDASKNGFSSLAPYLNVLDTMSALRLGNRQSELSVTLFGVNLSLMTLSLYLNSFLGLRADAAIEAARAQLT